MPDVNEPTTPAPNSPERKAMCVAEAQAVFEDLYRQLPNHSNEGISKTYGAHGVGAVWGAAYAQCMNNQVPRLIDSVRGR